MSAEPAEPASPLARASARSSSRPTRRSASCCSLVAVIGANLYVWNWLWTRARASTAATYARTLLQCITDHDAAVSAAPTLEAYRSRRPSALTACLEEASTGRSSGGCSAARRCSSQSPRRSCLLLPRWIASAPPAAAADGARTRRRSSTSSPRSRRRRSSRGAALALEPTRPVADRSRLRPTRKPRGCGMGGLVTRQIADPPAFRAVVRHELAHLRNRDVGPHVRDHRRSGTRSCSSGVLPFAVVVSTSRQRHLVALGWRLLALAALVYLTRNAVLRAREVYADVRASVPDGREGALRRILGGLPRARRVAVAPLWSGASGPADSGSRP